MILKSTRFLLFPPFFMNLAQEQSNRIGLFRWDLLLINMDIIN